MVLALFSLVCLWCCLLFIVLSCFSLFRLLCWHVFIVLSMVSAPFHCFVYCLACVRCSSFSLVLLLFWLVFYCTCSVGTFKAGLRPASFFYSLQPLGCCLDLWIACLVVEMLV